MLALSSLNEVYFWGKHHPAERLINPPLRIANENVADIAAIRGCSVSSFITKEGKVHFWGRAYGNWINQPVLTRFTSMADLFASLERPMMLEPLEINVKEPAVVEKLRNSFNDHVIYFMALLIIIAGEAVVLNERILPSIIKGNGRRQVTCRRT